MIVCISPSNLDIVQTATTLKFAEEAKKIMSKPRLKELIDKYKVIKWITFQCYTCYMSMYQLSCEMDISYTHVFIYLEWVSHWLVHSLKFQSTSRVPWSSAVLSAPFIDSWLCRSHGSHNLADLISFSSFFWVACLVCVLALKVLFLNRKLCELDIKMLSQSGLPSPFVPVNKLCLVLSCVSFLYQRSLHQHYLLKASLLFIQWSMPCVSMFLFCGTQATWALCFWPRGP
jgi:hypothetical protein